MALSVASRALPLNERALEELNRKGPGFVPDSSPDSNVYSLANSSMNHENSVLESSASHIATRGWEFVTARTFLETFPPSSWPSPMATLGTSNSTSQPSSGPCETPSPNAEPLVTPYKLPTDVSLPPTVLSSHSGQPGIGPGRDPASPTGSEHSPRAMTPQSQVASSTMSPSLASAVAATPSRSTAWTYLVTDGIIDLSNLSSPDQTPTPIPIPLGAEAEFTTKEDLGAWINRHADSEAGGHVSAAQFRWRPNEPHLCPYEQLVRFCAEDPACRKWPRLTDAARSAFKKKCTEHEAGSSLFENQWIIDSIMGFTGPRQLRKRSGQNAKRKRGAKNTQVEYKIKEITAHEVRQKELFVQVTWKFYGPDLTWYSAKNIYFTGEDEAGSEEKRDYEVKRIIGYKLDANGCDILYQAEWSQTGQDPTWYAAANFKKAPHVLQDFHRDNPWHPEPSQLPIWLEMVDSEVDDFECFNDSAAVGHKLEDGSESDAI